VELIFDCHTHLEKRNIKLVVVEFTNYVISWWDKFILSGRRNHKRPIDIWDKMKAIMRRKNRVDLNKPNSIANKQFILSGRRNHKRPIDIWDEMKAIMRSKNRVHTIKPKLRKKTNMKPRNKISINKTHK